MPTALLSSTSNSTPTSIYDLVTSIVHQTDLGIILLDANTHVLIWNPWIARASGKSRAHALGLPFRQLFPYAKDDLLNQAIAKALQHGETSTFTSKDQCALLPLTTDYRGEHPEFLAHEIKIKPITEAGSERFCLVEITDRREHLRQERLIAKQANELTAVIRNSDTQESLSQDLFDYSLEAIALIDTEQRIVKCNKQWALLFGPVPAPRLLRDLLTRDFKGLESPEIADLANGLPLELYARTPSGQMTPVTLRLPPHAGTGREAVPKHRWVFMQPRTASEPNPSLQEALAHSLQVALDAVGDAVITTRPDGRIMNFNRAAQQLTAWSIQDAVGASLYTIINLYDEVSLAPLFPDQSPDKIAARLPPASALLARRDHMRVAVEYSLNRWGESLNLAQGYILVLRDVSRTRESARKLAWASSHDPITGLANRSEFEHRLNELLNQAQEQNREHALLYLDLDQFKVVNDLCGHLAGDELLRQITALLKTRLRREDIFARLGGDEFGILLSDCSTAAAYQCAQTLRSLLANYRFQWLERAFGIGLCIGLVPVNKNSGSLGQILSNADAACYIAKDAGRNRVHIFEPDNAELTHRRDEMQWVSRLQTALDTGSLLLYGQSIAPLDAAQNLPPRVEILLRMTDEEGVIVPTEFIPAAERFNLMPAIDRWVIEHSFRFLAQHGWHAFPLININLSGQSIGDETFLNYLVDAMQKYSAQPERLCFEITETAAIANLAHATNLMKVLREMGCQFALDDFGTGLSSCAYLKHLTLDYLKIDGSFVRGIHTNPVDYAMLVAINQIGHVMGLKTVAEFVESEEIMTKLRDIGVDYVQGFAITRPSPLEDFRKQ